MHDPATPPPLLTPRAVAERINVKPKQVYVMLAPGGVLHSLRIDLGPKMLRIDAQKLEELIAAGGVAACN